MDNLAQSDHVVHLKCTIYTIGLSGVNNVFPKLFRLDKSETDGVEDQRLVPKVVTNRVLTA